MIQEDNIKAMRERHKEEIEQLRNSCPHLYTETLESSFEKREICINCGKLLKRER